MVSRFFMTKFRARKALALFVRALFFLNLILFFELALAFEKAQIKIKNATVQVEVAKTEAQRAQGLMGRTSLPAGQGMLFVFSYPQILTFWMKGTRMDLSIGFFDSNRAFLHALEMKQPASAMLRDDQLPRYSSQKPALYALEMPPGWFTQQRIKPGDTFEWVKPQP